MGAFIVISILFGINTLITTYLLCKKRDRDYIRSKIVTSVMFVLLGGLGLFLTQKDLLAELLPGLIFCLIGDGLLGMAGEAENGLKKAPFWAGIVSFSLAHLIFSRAFLGQVPMNTSLILLVAGAVIVITWITTISRKFDYKSHKLPCLIYSVFIGLLCASGCNLILGANGNIHFVILGIGGILFMISDLLLSMKLFLIKEPKGIRIFNLPVYYLAIFLIIYGAA
ncbi:MAG: lysoplasmalogenase family protein [Lachnospiraceae bacterium]